MNLAFWMVWRLLRRRWVALVITTLAISLATSVALIVPMVTRQVERGAQNAAQVFDLLVTAKGSPSQALMSSLFYLDVPIGNIPHAVLDELARLPNTKRVIPLALGDNYSGFPIIGTSLEFFEQRIKPIDPPYFKLNQGNLFKEEHEAVIGALVAREAGLHVGDQFKGAHGLTEVENEYSEHEEHEHTEHEDEEHEHNEHEHSHDEPYTVTGILSPTGGPIDRAVLTPIETVWEVHGTAKHDVTAILYSAQDLAGIYSTAQSINNGTEAMAVFPGQVFAQFKQTMLQGQAAYQGLSVLVLGIAALTVALSIYSSGVERKKSVALLRTLGAHRLTVGFIILLETFIVVLAGVLSGIMISILVGYLGATVLGARLGFTLAAPVLTWSLVFPVLCLIPIGLISALPPAFMAVRVQPLKDLK